VTSSTSAARNARERGGELVVVGRREGRGIRQNDPHATVGYGRVAIVRSHVESLFTATPCPPERRGYLPAHGGARHGGWSPESFSSRRFRCGRSGQLEAWSGMQSFGAIAASPRGSAELGRWLTELNHGLPPLGVSSGQANATLVLTRPRGSRGRDTDDQRTRRAPGLPADSALAGGGGSWGNFHATRRPRMADDPVSVEAVGLRRRRGGRAREIVAGDANLRPGEATGLRAAPGPRLSSAPAARGSNRPDPRARSCSQTQPAAWPDGAPPREWTAPVGSCAGRNSPSDDVRTRARGAVSRCSTTGFAYSELPGTNGPLAKGDGGMRFRREGAQRDLPRGSRRQAVLRGDGSSCAETAAPGLCRSARSRAGADGRSSSRRPRGLRDGARRARSLGRGTKVDHGPIRNTSA